MFISIQLIILVNNFSPYNVRKGLVFIKIRITPLGPHDMTIVTFPLKLIMSASWCIFSFEKIYMFVCRISLNMSHLVYNRRMCRTPFCQSRNPSGGTHCCCTVVTRWHYMSWHHTLNCSYISGTMWH